MAEYIERETALEAVAKLDQKIRSNVLTFHQVKRLIETAPAADVAKVVCGKWLERRRKNGVGKVCSACMTAFNFAPTPYCPECGAKMDLDGET